MSDGGDAACWLDQVCDDCGRLREDRHAAVCEHCGATVQGPEPAGPPRAERGRDRDAQGRARNARPRDGLGRPLPYGADGVQRQPEGVPRTPQQTLAEAQRLLDAGMPFHAHEVFEDAWKAAAEPERGLWRGLAQLAVGLTHAARGNPTGAVALLGRAAAAIAPYATDPQTTDPQSADPHATDPQTTDPQSADPHATDSQSADPYATDPQSADPHATDPHADSAPYGIATAALADWARQTSATLAAGTDPGTALVPPRLLG